MKKDTKIILICFGILILIAAIIIIRVFLFEKEKNDWNDYAYDYCSDWRAYDMGNVFNLSENEMMPFDIYLLIKNTVISENWESSYLECCRVFDMDCKEMLLEEDNSTVIFVAVENTTYRYRLINFNYTEKEQLFVFQNYGNSANGSYIII